MLPLLLHYHLISRGASWYTCGRSGHYPRIDYSSGTLIRWNKRDTDRCPAKRWSLCKQEDDREPGRAKGADQRSREVNLLNQVVPAGMVSTFDSIRQRMRHFVAIMGSLGPKTIHRSPSTRIPYVGRNILQSRILELIWEVSLLDL